MYFDKQKQWLKMAEDCLPKLITSDRRPISVVRAIKDSTKFQGWAMENIGSPNLVLGTLQPRTAEFVLDFALADFLFLAKGDDFFYG
jgi:hypothetical protein